MSLFQRCIGWRRRCSWFSAEDWPRLSQTCLIRFSDLVIPNGLFRMITCDVFDLNAVVDGRTLRWTVRTDLPGGTRIIVSVSRRYVDTRGDECVWSLWGDSVLLTATGPGDCVEAKGALNIDEGDAHGLSRFNELLGPYSSGIVNPVGPEIQVQVTVGARQPMKAFGKNNCNLSGGMVSNSGGINIVREVAVVSVEMCRENQPIDVDES